MTAMDRAGRILVAGHNGLVGSAILRRLKADGATDILTADRADLDLTDARAVDVFFEEHTPRYVFLAAGKVGGILANDSFPGDFVRENLSIQLNVIESSRRHDVEKLLFPGSSCIYPKLAPQPMREDYLLTGPLEPTNEAYAVAKIAGIVMCQAYRRQFGCNFISVMPTNLYGTHDNFDLESSHVIPALIRKFHEAKVQGEPEVEVWGSGRPRREFLHVDDLADACVFLMDTWNQPEIVNIGVGEDTSVADLAELVRTTVGYSGRIVFDPDKPDGPPQKLLDVSRLHGLGWTARTSLSEGLKSTYRWFLSNLDGP